MSREIKYHMTCYQLRA